MSHTEIRFKPLVTRLLVWTKTLRSHVSPTLRHRLLLCQGARGTSAWTSSLAKHVVRRDFLVRHGLPAFSLASIRPSVLTAFYRASGDLRQVKTVANHSHIGTTVRYVEGPQVEAEHRARVAALQNAFLGHIERPSPGDRPRKAQIEKAVALDTTQIPAARAVSLFGFDCKDPFAGIAPASRRGELCTQFLGCFTCPNAVIPADAATRARLLQARDHLRAAAAQRP